MDKNNKISTLEKTLQLIKEVEVNPQLTQRDLAKRLEISLGKINYLINALIKKGMIEVINFKNSKNKLAYKYMLTPEGLKTKISLVREFLNWKISEYEKIKREIEFCNEELKITK